MGWASPCLCSGGDLSHPRGARGPGEPRAMQGQTTKAKTSTPTSCPGAEATFERDKCQVKAESSSIPPWCRKMKVVLGFWRRPLQPEGGRGVKRGFWGHWQALHQLHCDFGAMSSVCSCRQPERGRQAEGLGGPSSRNKCSDICTGSCPAHTQCTLLRKSQPLGMAGRIKAPKHVHVLIPICQQLPYVTGGSLWLN